MDPADSTFLRHLFDSEPIASLATLHRGEPAVSMVPFVLRAGGDLLIHVSALATHTRDMRDHPRVALLVVAPPAPEAPPQARPRISLVAGARFLEPGAPNTDAARADYLARFPDAAVTFDLADFSLVALVPESARLVAGFGRAHGLAGAALREWLGPPSGQGG